MGYYRKPNFKRKDWLDQLFYCLQCENLFEVPKIHTEYGECWGRGYSEITNVCPLCNGEVVHLTKKCGCCGEYITGEYIETQDGNYYCENCYTKGDILEDVYD